MVIGSTLKFKNLKETSYCIKELERRFSIQSECLLTNALVNGQLWRFAFRQALRRVRRGERGMRSGMRGESADGLGLRREASVTTELTKHGID